MENLKGLQVSDLKYYKFDSITYFNVERSFSSYNNLLVNNRSSFIRDNIKKISVTKYKFNLFG